MRTKMLTVAFAVCAAAVQLGSVFAEHPIPQEQQCCVPHDASGEKELAKAIRIAVAEGSHEMNAEATLARELANEAEAKQYKEEDKKLVAAEKKAALAREAEEDAKHELREEEEKDTHEEAETSALSQERVATAKNVLQHEEANLEKLVAEEEKLARTIEDAEHEIDNAAMEAKKEAEDTESFFLALRRIKGPHHAGLLVA